MNRRILAVLGATVSLSAAVTVPAGAKAPATSSALASAIAAPTRAELNRARDRYRHPQETLSFFGVKPSDTVVEVWPGGGWYTEILAPYLRQGGGAYWAADLESNLAGIARTTGADPTRYGQVRTAIFPAFAPADSRV